MQRIKNAQFGQINSPRSLCQTYLARGYRGVLYAPPLHRWGGGGGGGEIARVGVIVIDHMTFVNQREGNPY